MTDLEPGRLARIAPGVHRLIAPNPSLMTGPGTNTYLLGAPATALIDPGPLSPEHLERIVASSRLERIFLTHSHPDHAAGTAALVARTGARLVARRPPQDAHHDRSFQADVEPADDQVFALDVGTLRAIHTPGHASNHVCYLLEASGLLFSGDHILDGVTPVIMPPDGVMRAYLESLQRLKGYPLRAIAPGHGRVLDEPVAVIDGILEHRAQRERKVLRALQASGSARLDDLVARVYADVSPRLHPLARRSLEAHLIKLEEDGRCRLEGEYWHAA